MMLRAVNPSHAKEKRVPWAEAEAEEGRFPSGFFRFLDIVPLVSDTGITYTLKGQMQVTSKGDGGTTDTQQHKMTDHRIGIERKVNWVLCWKDGRVSC